MKVIIVEGTDNTGKDTVINNIVEMYKFNKPKVIHCEKPKSNNWANAALEQNETFLGYVNDFAECEETDVVIFNRAWYGEYVYGCMYRHRTDDDVKKMITEVEDRIAILKTLRNDFDIYYIQLLSSSPELLKKNDDGLSISEADIDKMKLETERFEDIFEFSGIYNKKLIWVNDGDDFRSRESIMNDVKCVLQ